MFKSKLQELCQKRGLTLPSYASEKGGSDHCPRFAATVSVNGALFHTPSDGYRSSKEAQNSAAQVAFEVLSGVGYSYGHVALPPSSVLPTLPQAPSTIVAIEPTTEVPQQNKAGNIQSNDKVNVKPIASSTIVVIEPTQEVPQQNSGGIIQSNDKVNVKPPEMLHMYKNRLQQYVQKNNLSHDSHPAYASEFDGPAHCRRFKARVTVDGRTYQCSEYYSTLKDAEHAAAKVALESLSTVENEESDGLVKTLLQELALKEGYQYPSYSTNKSGLSHMPTFVSIVEVDGAAYQGEECKTKKQSEMSAAKVAFEKLINRKVAHEELGKRIASPRNTSRIIVDENVGAKMTPKVHLKRTADGGEGCSRTVATGTDGKGSAPILGCGVIADTLQNNNPKPAEKIEYQRGKAEGYEGNGKRYKCSDENMHHQLPETFSPSPALSNASRSSPPSEIVKSVEARLAGGSGFQDSKILVIRHGSGVEVPQDGSVLHDAEGWMAVQVNPAQDE